MDNFLKETVFHHESCGFEIQRVALFFCTLVCAFYLVKSRFHSRLPFTLLLHRFSLAFVFFLFVFFLTIPLKTIKVYEGDVTSGSVGLLPYKVEQYGALITKRWPITKENPEPYNECMFSTQTISDTDNYESNVPITVVSILFMTYLLHSKTPVSYTDGALKTIVLVLTLFIMLMMTDIRINTHLNNIKQELLLDTVRRRWTLVFHTAEGHTWKNLVIVYSVVVMVLLCLRDSSTGDSILVPPEVKTEEEEDEEESDDEEEGYKAMDA